MQHDLRAATTAQQVHHTHAKHQWLRWLILFACGLVLIWQAVWTLGYNPLGGGWGGPTLRRDLSQAAACAHAQKRNDDINNTSAFRSSDKHFGGRCRYSERFANVTVTVPLRPLDAPLFAYMVRSFEIFFPCYAEMVIIIIKGRVPLLSSVIPAYARVVELESPFEPALEYFTQQWMRLILDSYVKTDFVLAAESDLVMSSAFVEDMFFATPEDPKIYIVMDNQTRCYNGNAVMWRHGTTVATGMEMTVCNYISRTPLLFPTALFRETRKLLEEVHGMPLADLLLQNYSLQFRNQDWRPSNAMFSEFNVVANVAYHRYHNEYRWVTVGPDAPLNAAVHLHYAELRRQVRNASLENSKLTQAYFNKAQEVMHKGICAHPDAFIRSRLCPLHEKMQ